LSARTTTSDAEEIETQFSRELGKKAMMKEGKLTTHSPATVHADTPTLEEHESDGDSDIPAVDPRKKKTDANADNTKRPRRRLRPVNYEIAGMGGHSEHDKLKSKHHTIADKLL
jgi:hypothetical protein